MSAAAQKAYLYLKNQILNGDVPAGEHVSEAEIAISAGVSRTPVREAIRRLSSEGLLLRRPHLGAVVPKWSQEELEDVFSLRALLESKAAERAASRISLKELDHLASLAEEMLYGVTPLTDVDQLDEGRTKFGELNGQFHAIIVAAAQSIRLSTMLEHVIHIPLSVRTILRYDKADLIRSAGHHIELVSAFRARDGAWAASVMRSHILAAWHAISRESTKPTV
ncbi:GntR family transcriptional regulator [Candidatus Phycosocius spiralis]|uniref:GntR family transcriptional regulator n=1 Tax=Candidatus Phycosocius spiralis TaxID=2815099 RepID=A0ABQ4PV17_9PROT|nr:GntR family transcriptional regulator [Candidatus Phycosocius spiralis]GIU66862.1 GntR family transcriptional regulator [Candidatus Phycosocius spiralis]